MQIKIYSRPDCDACEKAKEFFKKKSLEFLEIDISKDLIAAKEIMMRTGQMSVPVITIDDFIMVGFAPVRLEAALERRKISDSPND